MTVDCVVSVRTGLPSDRMGNRLSESGRWLLIETLGALHGLRVEGRDLARDEHKRWSLPRHRLHLSVAHAAGLAVVALSSEQPVGVDLQDERHRPLAMAWLGELIGLPGGTPATMRQLAECESLIKASHITKETFAGVRLPGWEPGWRAGNVGHHHLSTPVGDMQLALAAGRPAPVRWWSMWRGTGLCRPVAGDEQLAAGPAAWAKEEAIAC